MNGTGCSFFPPVATNPLGDRLRGCGGGFKAAGSGFDQWTGQILLTRAMGLRAVVAIEREERARERDRVHFSCAIK